MFKININHVSIDFAVFGLFFPPLTGVFVWHSVNSHLQVKKKCILFYEIRRIFGILNFFISVLHFFNGFFSFTNVI